MDTRKNDSTSAGLPYVNNIQAILFTIVINTVCILIFTWNKPITLLSVIISTLSCCVVASVMITLMASSAVRKMRGAGALPASVPESKMMTRLPKNPALLSLVFAVFFGGVALLLNLTLIRFYEIQTFTLLRLLVWQGAYCCLISAIIGECAVLRYVQADCSDAKAPPQTGVVKVKNPVTRINAFKNWLSTVLVDFGTNMAIGLVFGATRVMDDHSIVINPTTRDSIIGASVVIGVIIAFRMSYPILKSLRGARDSGKLPSAPKRNGFLSALPDKPMGLTLTLMLPIIALSFAVFWSVLTFFGFKVLSFFQFYIIRSIYTALLTKGMIAFATARYRQPVTQKDAAVSA